MAKKKGVSKKPDAEVYEYVKAIKDSEGNLRWEYKLVGNDVVGRQDHDEDVGGWSDREIEKLTRSTLDVPPKFKIAIEEE